MILGLDPGTATVGYAFCEGNRLKPEIVDYGVLTTQSLPKGKMPDRLLELGRDLEILLDKYSPKKAVVEDLFFFKNQKTVISVAQSRGMMLYLLSKRGVPIVSVTPLQVKQAICGYGRATKRQVQEMVRRIYRLETKPDPDDAADSLAMAWMHLK